MSIAPPALPRCDSLCRNMHCRSCNHFTHSAGECKCTGSSFFNAAAFGCARKIFITIFSVFFKVIVFVSISTLCKCSFRRFSVGSFIIHHPAHNSGAMQNRCKANYKKAQKVPNLRILQKCGRGRFPAFVLFRLLNLWLISDLYINDVELMRFLILFDFLY